MSEEISYYQRDLIFENNQIPSASLPDIQFVKYEPLQRNLFYSNLLVVSIVFGSLLFGLCVTVFLSTVVAKYFFYLLPLLLVIIGFIAFAEWKEFPMRGYSIREHDILIKEGWLWRSVSVVPFNRVQHIELHQGPIDRMFEISALNIYTAGETSTHELTGLTIDQAGKIKEYIMQRSHTLLQTKDQNEPNSI